MKSFEPIEYIENSRGSKISKGCLVQVVKEGGCKDWIGKVTQIHEVVDQVRVKFESEGQVICFHKDDVDRYVGNMPVWKKSETKMLHELIALAKCGKKFKVKSIYGKAEFTHEQFTNDDERWLVPYITSPWQYEEVREPRVVEFEGDWTMAKFGDAFVNEPRLCGAKWKIVATEVIE